MLLKHLSVIAVCFGTLLGCSSSSSSSTPPLVNTVWEYQNGESGLGLKINDLNMYEITWLEVTSFSSANAELETGTVVMTDSKITFYPQHVTCSGETDPPYAISYAFSGNSLEIAFPTNVIVFQEDTATPWSAGNITLGCFEPSGDFVVTPLTPVQSP